MKRRLRMYVNDMTSFYYFFKWVREVNIECHKQKKDYSCHAKLLKKKRGKRKRQSVHRLTHS